MISRGDTFFAPHLETGATQHLWIVVVDPHPTTQECLVVSVTTLQGAKDQTVILQKGDHPFLRRQSVVYYVDTRIINASDIEASIADGKARFHQPCTQAVLSLVRAGVLGSDFTSRKIRRFYQEAVREGR